MDTSFGPLSLQHIVIFAAKSQCIIGRLDTNTSQWMLGTEGVGANLWTACPVRANVCVYIYIYIIILYIILYNTYIILILSYMSLYDEFCSIDRDGRRMLKVLSRSFQTPSRESFCRLVGASINSCRFTKTVSFLWSSNRQPLLSLQASQSPPKISDMVHNSIPSGKLT